MILEELKNPEKFEIILPKLVKILDDNPSVNLYDNLQGISPAFQRFIKNALESYRDNAKGKIQF